MITKTIKQYIFFKVINICISRLKMSFNYGANLLSCNQNDSAYHSYENQGCLSRKIVFFIVVFCSLFSRF